MKCPRHWARMWSRPNGDGAVPKPRVWHDLASSTQLGYTAFATYIAVVAQNHQARVGDMLVYMRLILREVQKYREGMGWLTYDSLFQQNNQGLTARWDTLDPSLHTAYITCKGVPATPLCRHCRGVDYTAANCALSHLIPPVRPGNVQHLPASTGDRKCGKYNRGKWGFIGQSWNWGKCRFPGNCYYKYICAVCGEIHTAKEYQQQVPDDPRRLQA